LQQAPEPDSAGGPQVSQDLSCREREVRWIR
jgi:hypothetical protein